MNRNKPPFEIIVADISQLNLEAIVNAANPTLMGGGGVDGAIHQSAGPLLKEACKALGGCETGQAKITKGFDCKASWIIHTVGPIWQGGHMNEKALLNACYKNSLLLAKSYAIKNIAFPAISTGVYGFPKDIAAHVAIQTILEYTQDFDKIITCLFSKEEADLYHTILHNNLKHDF